MTPLVCTLPMQSGGAFQNLLLELSVFFEVVGTSSLAIVLASYRIEKPQIPENRKRNRQKNRKNWGKIGGKNRKFQFFAYFSPIFWISGFFYSVAGHCNRNSSHPPLEIKEVDPIGPATGV